MTRSFCAQNLPLALRFSGRALANFTFVVVMLVACALIALTGVGQVQAEEDVEAPEQQLSNRIDFGSAQIMGQSNTSGAVYLMNRKQNEIESMLTQRTDYRKEILADFEFDVDSRLSGSVKNPPVNTLGKTNPPE